MTKKMVKNLMLVLAMVVLCFAVAMTASAEDRTVVDSGECGAQGDNVIWTLYDDGELVISGEGEMKDYGEAQDNGWYSILSKEWFKYAIYKVTIENGITHIGSCAFYSSYGDVNNQIKTIDIADSVKSIGERAFEYCNSLESIIIPDGVTKIEGRTFEDCSNLRSVTIPDSVETIGYESFYGCYKLKNIDIPSSVTTVEDRAFRLCESLTDIFIPENLTSIGFEVFEGCWNLEKIIVDENNPVYSSDEHGVLFNKDKTELIWYPSGNEAAEYVVPDTVHTIKSMAFYVPFDLERIVLPYSLKKLEEGSITYMFRLKELSIPESVETIDSLAIAFCNFADVNIKSMDAQIGAYSLNVADFYIDGVTQDEFADLWEMSEKYGVEEATYEMFKYIIYTEGQIIHTSTIYCHSGSTAETYAIENGADYVLTHFFDNGWIYDYDNMIRYRECTLCDYTETELLETTTEDDVEIIEPTNPDTDFVVDVVTDYVVIEEALSNSDTVTDWEIVKAFDINLKNKDGVHVQPDGTVKVKLPLDWSKDGVYKVYRVNDDGTLTDMQAYRQGSHMVFETDHFSIYVIVAESEKTDTPVTPDEPQEETKDDFVSKLFDFLNALIDLLLSIFK